MTAFLIDNFPQARAEHMSQPRFTDRLDLAAVPTAVGCSRAFTKLALTSWGASSIVDDALLVVSELVTNAVEATGVTEVHPTWVELDKLNLVGVRLLGLETSIVIEVLDVDPYLPTKPQGEKLDAESGRGLFLVNEIAKRWGSYPTRPGKVVWAELALPLPQRKRRTLPEPKRPVAMEHDPALLHRVMDGLRELGGKD